ncbi:hypothetical protein [Polaromonas glacialis]|uniref:hypothetical protein n=1 Tax=Polaromonas glacialis TaxID=866564 RepID=UPI000497634A|nr:hypothetical protein [Polaromonas glacialis]
MNIALAGLTAREEVALGMLVGKSLPGWQCLPATDGPGAPLPPAELYVVDLAGRGMARWTDAAQDELLKALGGAPAVLVAPAFDQTWSALGPHCSQSQPLVLLNKPYGVEAMRAALQQAAAGRTAPARSTAMKPAAPDRVRTAQARPSSRPLLPVEPAQTLPTGTMALPDAVERPPLAAPALVEGTLASSEFQARMAALPGMPLFLRRLAESLAQQQPFELRISFVNRMIFHPGEQWAASNTPAPVLEQLCKDDELASSIEIDAIDSRDARARAARLDIPAQPLQALLWKLVQLLPG